MYWRKLNVKELLDFTSHGILFGCSHKKYEVRRVGSMYGEEERWILEFGGEN